MTHWGTGCTDPVVMDTDMDRASRFPFTGACAQEMMNMKVDVESSYSTNVPMVLAVS